MLENPLKLRGHQFNGAGVMPVHARRGGPTRTENKRKMAGVPRPPSHTSRGVPDVGEAPRQYRRQWTGGVTRMVWSRPSAKLIRWIFVLIVTPARACQKISAMWRLRLSWVQRRAPSQEPSRRFGVWDPHENPGHRPNDRNPVTSQSEVETGKHLKCRWRKWSNVASWRHASQLMKDENGRMTTGCLQCAVLMSSPRVFHRTATAGGESFHHDTLDVLGALLHSAGESRKLFVSARMTSSASTQRSHFVWRI